jgi:hypothetical protein
MTLKSPPSTPYNWRATRSPERPYNHSYHTSLVDKVFLCRKPDPQTGEPARVYMTFEGALERIRWIDAITRGIPKIVYLVGWQFDGHDSKYPAWSEVNPRLKRSQDSSPAHSLRWLMKAARQYHTTVSLHINMMEAYENSPLWEEYRKNRIILAKGGIWDGEQAYLVDYAREWELGLAQRRIDDLCRLLPLVDAGTVHIDAFFPTGDDRQASLAAMRRIVRYWRNKGIDVTTECIATPNLDKGLVGLSPMVWHLNHAAWKKGDEFTEDDYLAIPASLFCAAADHSYRAALFGTSMQGEPLGNDQAGEYLTEFCLKTLVWQYLNRFERTGLVKEGEIYYVEYAEGLTVRYDRRKEDTLIRQDELILRDGDDLFVPVPWQPEPEIIAYSRDGYASRTWRLPHEWEDAGAIRLSRITASGLEGEIRLPVLHGQAVLSLAPGEALSLLKEK